MAYAIIRIEKVKTRQGIGQRQAHNDRSKYTPNADESRLAFNQEYINADHRKIVELVDERMESTKVGKPRKGAVLCLEVLMTASPEAPIWQRDGRTGQAADMRGSAWVQKSITWAKQQWGANLVAMKLHQDEKTPHFQCFVVPVIAPDGGLAAEAAPGPRKAARLSARDMFSPRSLSQLQTDFSEVMEPFGLERGIKGSRAYHRTMKQMYALGQEKAAEVAALVAPAPAQPFTLEKPPIAGRDTWRDRTEERINQEIARQVGAVNERLNVAGGLAVASVGAAAQSERSRTWADDSLQKADAAHGQINALTAQVAKELRQAEAEREQHAAELDLVLLQVAQGNLPANLVQRGQELAAEQLEALRREWPVVRALQAQADQAERAGDYGLVAELRFTAIPAAENQLAEYRRQAQTMPAGQALITELENADRLAQTRQLDAERQTIEASARAEAAQKVRDAQQLEANRTVEALRVSQEAEAKRARQEADERTAVEARKALHQQAQMEELESAQRKYGWKGEVVRVRVTPDQVELVQKSVGLAIKDEAAGADGRIGISIVYNPNASTWGVSALLDKVRARHGEVFERPQAAAQRRITTEADFARVPGYVAQQRKDKGSSEYEM